MLLTGMWFQARRYIYAGTTHGTQHCDQHAHETLLSLAASRMQALLLTEKPTRARSSFRSACRDLGELKKCALLQGDLRLSSSWLSMMRLMSAQLGGRRRKARQSRRATAAELSERVLESEQQIPHCPEIAAGCPLVRGIELCSAQDVPGCRRMV